MNVWVVYADSGAYSDWDRVVSAVFSSREAADRYAAENQAKHEAENPAQHPSKHWPGICYGTHYESSGDEFWVVDALKETT